MHTYLNRGDCSWDLIHIPLLTFDLFMFSNTAGLGCSTQDARYCDGFCSFLANERAEEHLLKGRRWQNPTILIKA